LYKVKNLFTYIGIKLIKFTGIILLLILWEIAPRLGLVDSQFLPPLTSVLLELKKLWLKGGLYTHIMVSFWRTLVGLMAAIIIAIPMGLYLGRRSTAMLDLLNPLFRLFAQVNPYSISPIFILFFGLGEVAKIAVVAWVCIWPLLFNTITGVRTIDPILIKTSRAIKINEFQLIRKVILPASSSNIFSGLRIGVEMAFFMLIAAEMVGATAGLGWLIHNASLNSIFVRVYASGICIVVLGVCLNKFLNYIKSGIFFWKETETEQFKLTNTVARIGRLKLSAIALVFAALIAVSSMEVYKSGVESSSIEHHHDLDMDSGSATW
jgi:NitT/TauT family transport system permease protein